MRTVMLCLLFVWFGSAARAEERFNVLFLVADDLNCAIGPYGDAGAITPNLDRLADRSLVFQRAYCQQAVCNPSRSSFLTGLRPNTVGVDDLRKSFRDTAPQGDSLATLPEHFKQHGYFCQNIGKIFHNMGETQDRRSWSIDEVLFEGPHYEDTVFWNTPEKLRKPLERGKAPVTESHAVPDLAYRDGQIANLAAAMLRDYPTGGRPFFLAVGFWRPHLPFVAPKRYWDMYDAGRVPRPQPAQAPQGAPSIALHDSREIRGYGNVPDDGRFTEAEIQHLRHGYYASISFLDAQVGKILDALSDGGHAERTIIVFTSDHGFHIGEHGLWGKTTNLELDARVPLLVSDPRRARRRSSSALVELVDLYPTLAELAGVEDGLSQRLEGTSLRPIVDDPRSSVKSAAFTQHQQPFYGSSENWQAWGYSIRTDAWRYTEWRRIEDQSLMANELYDLRGQENETINVAEERPQTLARLSKQLAEHFDY